MTEVCEAGLEVDFQKSFLFEVNFHFDLVFSDRSRFLESISVSISVFSQLRFQFVASISISIFFLQWLRFRSWLQFWTCCKFVWSLGQLQLFVSNKHWWNNKLQTSVDNLRRKVNGKASEIRDLQKLKVSKFDLSCESFIFWALHQKFKKFKHIVAFKESKVLKSISPNFSKKFQYQRN